MRSRLLKLFSRKNDQSGLASIIIVGVLIILLTIISLGFAKIMDRSVNNSLNNQLGAAANYAAQSGLNDAIVALKGDSGLSSDNCSKLFAVGQPLENKNNLSGDGNTKYTCVLIDQTPDSILQDSVDANKSWVVKLDTEAPPNGLDSLMFSWNAVDRSKTNLPPPPPGNPTLLSETDWNNAPNNYLPLLRVTLYPVPPGGGDLSNAQTKSRTFFIFPTNKGGNVTNISYKSTADGELIQANCNGKNNAGDFKVNYDCNVIIGDYETGGAGGTGPLDYFYARITPIYNQANLKVQAQKSKSPNPEIVDFKNVQALIDITGKSNSATKRLQARINLDPNNCGPNDNCAPEEAVRSAKRICKRLNVSSDVTIDAFNYCDIPIKPPPSPSCAPGKASYFVGDTVSFTASSGYGPGTYSWDASDGGGTPASGSGNSFTTSYAAAGTKTVTVTSKDPLSSNSSTGSCTVIIKVVPPVTCSPASQSVAVTDPVAFTAGGGDGSYSWSAPGGSPSSGGPGSSFTTSYASTTPSLKTVTVTSRSFSATCSVTVTGGGGGGGGGCYITAGPIPNTVDSGQGFTVTGRYSHCYDGCHGYTGISGAFGWQGPNPDDFSDNNVPFTGPGFSAYGGGGWGGIDCNNGGAHAYGGIYVNGPPPTPPPPPCSPKC